MSMALLNLDYLKSGIVLFVDTDGRLMGFGNAARRDLSARLREREQDMAFFLITQARKEVR